MSFLKNLFGGGDPQVQNQPLGFNAGGLSVGSLGEVTPLAQRTDAVAGLTGADSAAADTYGNLAKTVQPGFNGLLDARLTDLNNTARSSIGSLSDNLAARRVLGSSFGQDTITRAKLGFQQQRDSTIADNFLKSLAVNQQLTQSEYQARAKQFSDALDELNFETNVGTQINGKANAQLSSNAQAQAKLDAGAQQGAGSFLGTAIGTASKALPYLLPLLA